MTRHLTLSVLALAGLTMIAACGSAGAKGAAQVASVAGDATTTTTAAASDSTSEADAQQAMLDFAACMREHGVDMPDPTFDSAGAASVIVKGDGQAGPPADTDKFNEAASACQSEGLGGAFSVSSGDGGQGTTGLRVGTAAGQ